MTGPALCFMAQVVKTDFLLNKTNQYNCCRQFKNYMPPRNRLAETKPDIIGHVLTGLYNQKTAVDIHKALLKKFPDRHEEIGSGKQTERLVNNVRQRVAGFPEEKQNLDNPVEFHKLGEHGLPSEATSYLLEMWKFAVELFVDEPEVAQCPTLREVNWWWRVHEADPGLDMTSVWRLASVFLGRDINHDFGDVPLEFSDLYSLLAQVKTD